MPQKSASVKELYKFIHFCSVESWHNSLPIFIFPQWILRNSHSWSAICTAWMFNVHISFALRQKSIKLPCEHEHINRAPQIIFRFACETHRHTSAAPYLHSRKCERNFDVTHVHSFLPFSLFSFSLTRPDFVSPWIESLKKVPWQWHRKEKVNIWFMIVVSLSLLSGIRCSIFN
jgi:hypothetical protein